MGHPLSTQGRTAPKASLGLSGRAAAMVLAMGLGLLGDAHAQDKPKPAAKPAAAQGKTPAKPAQPATATKAKVAAGAAAGATAAAATASAKPAATGSFSDFVAALWPAAQAKGVSRATFDAALRGFTPDPQVAALTRKQAEFVRPIWSYLQGAVTGTRIAEGQRHATSLAGTLSAIESRTGVDRGVVLGIWGMETSFGSFTGGKDVIRSLATLAHLRYRGTFFRDELITALLILQEGHVERSEMKGSWAGAMGQTQFMPSSFMKWAVDHDGDGHKDIWGSVPDALASTANYLRQHGWQPGLPWGFEVVLPQGFDWKTHKAPLATWASLGVRRVDGEAIPRQGEATLFLPAGARGPVFLVTGNYAVIKAYNSSDAYALAVGHLGDRIEGGPAIQARWPTDGPQLDQAGRKEVQRRLVALGYDVGEPDGRIGSRTRDAVRSFQVKSGLVPDGYPSPEVLQALRRRP